MSPTYMRSPGFRLPSSFHMRTTRLRLLAAAGALAVAAAPDARAQTAARRPLPSAIEAPAAPDLIRLSGTIERLVARVRPAVVQVLTTAYLPGETARPGALLGTQRAARAPVSCSNAAGYIVTNAHVVRGRTPLQVVLAPPGGRALRARVDPQARGTHGRRAARRHRRARRDLAAAEGGREGSPALPLGDSDALRQGQIVLAFGSPLGFENSVTMGVVSSVARQLKPDAA